MARLAAKGGDATLFISLTDHAFQHELQYFFDIYNVFSQTKHTLSLQFTKSSYPTDGLTGIRVSISLVKLMVAFLGSVAGSKRGRRSQGAWSDTDTAAIVKRNHGTQAAGKLILPKQL